MNENDDLRLAIHNDRLHDLALLINSDNLAGPLYVINSEHHEIDLMNFTNIEDLLNEVGYYNYKFKIDIYKVPGLGTYEFINFINYIMRNKRNKKLARKCTLKSTYINNKIIGGDQVEILLKIVWVTFQVVIVKSFVEKIFKPDDLDFAYAKYYRVLKFILTGFVWGILYFSFYLLM